MAALWPKEHGSQCLPGSLQTTFNDVAADYDTPGSICTIGFGMCMATLLAHGSEANKVLTAPGGGTDEVMRNILGERVLGHPKEPSVNRDMPYNDLSLSVNLRSAHAQYPHLRRR